MSSGNERRADGLLPLSPTSSKGSSGPPTFMFGSVESTLSLDPSELPPSPPLPATTVGSPPPLSTSPPPHATSVHAHDTAASTADPLSATPSHTGEPPTAARVGSQVIVGGVGPDEAAFPPHGPAVRVRPAEEVEALKTELLAAAHEILSQHTGYDLLPESGKVVVFDSCIPVKYAFLGLTEHQIKGAPVWDSDKRQFTGMLTITDFIDILRHFHYNKSMSASTIADHLEKQSIRDWNAINQKQGTAIGTLVHVPAADSILKSVHTMMLHRIHRICVMGDDANVLSVLTLHRILRYLSAKFRAKKRQEMKAAQPPSQLDSPADDIDTPTGTSVPAHTSIYAFLSLTVRELKVGTFAKVRTVRYSTPLIQALDELSRGRVSGLPIVDERGAAVDMYSRSDVRYLALDNTFDVGSMTVGDALSKHKYNRPVPFCSPDDSLETVIRVLISTAKHRILCVDDRRHVLGLVSLSDIFGFFTSTGWGAPNSSLSPALSTPSAGTPMSMGGHVSPPQLNSPHTSLKEPLQPMIAPGPDSCAPSQRKE